MQPQPIFEKSATHASMAVLLSVVMLLAATMGFSVEVRGEAKGDDGGPSNKHGRYW